MFLISLLQVVQGSKPVGSFLVPAGQTVIAFLLLLRGAELILARRHTRRLVARGAVEHGAAHYPLIVVLPVLGHATWHLYRRAVTFPDPAAG
ncbi:hypothetical protein [Paracoccus actinidiae]|jgi:hypothetical protein|uniref:hypothetical protein n=1 Tax=Paracoccus actinidiae TaxID=3064531 RepID=UPI0027D29417|nr:hypothetical protein [Paracoccus sp. M09]